MGWSIRKLLIPVAEERHVLLTRLTRVECAERIDAQLSPRFFSPTWFRTNDPARRPIAGWASEDEFAIIKNDPYIRNSLSMEATGQLTALPTGTRIAVRLGIRESVVFVTWLNFAVWLFMEAVVVVAFLGSLLGPGPIRSDLLIAVLVMAPWPAIYGVVVRLLRSYVIGDDRFLLTFLKNSLLAEEIAENQGA